jgi:iron complex outermembrane recepter protein
MRGKTTLFGGCLVSAIALSAFMGPAAVAQETTGPQEDQQTGSVVVVTGSLIATTPEDAAIPVDVITAEALQDQGSPTLVELIRTIPSVSGGNIGESNRFLGNAAAGVATINLRGLGLTRTLSLMNGERLATITAAGGQEFVNVNVVPSIAVGQVEVLRDGAAVTYGSDAVAGVVNFITRKDLEGFEAQANYALIDGSDGDYESALAWGHQFDRGNILLAGSYRHRSQLNGVDLPFTLPAEGLAEAQRRGLPLTAEVSGISGASNPGGYNIILGAPVRGPNGGFLPGATAGSIQGATLSATVNDLGCAGLGGLQFAAAGQCFYPFTYHDTRVANEDHYHLYSELNFDLSDDVRFHGEVLWSRTDVPDDRVSASQSTVQFPTPIEASGGSPGGGTSPIPAPPGSLQSRFFVPGNNPGLQALFNPCPTNVSATQFSAANCAAALANGVAISQTAWRPVALGGNPLTGDADEQTNQVTSFRIAGGFDGDLSNGWTWKTSVNYMRTEQYTETPDRSVNRVQLALRGLGGPNCNPNTGTPGVGPCQWFNPFSNSITLSSINGATYTEATGRPQGPTNSIEVWDWIQEDGVSTTVQQLFTAEAQLGGEFGDLRLWSQDPIKWAIGTQYRFADRVISLSDNFDGQKTPCVDSPPFGDGLPTCPVPGNGPFTFIGSGTTSQLDTHVAALFGELKIPITDSLELGAAIRSERYGGNVGTTTNPRATLRWQALDWLAFRASTGSTFRAPPAAAITPGFGTIQAQFTNPVTGAPLYRPVQTFANPDLIPETADTYNIGILFDVGGFNAQIDYFNFDFQDEITTETAARVYGTMFPGANPATWACGNAALLGRFTFGTDTVNTQLYNGAAVPTCHPNNFLSVRNNVINGPATNVSGVDANASYVWDNVFNGVLTLGGDASYLTNFDRGASFLLGTNIIYDPALNRVNKSELLSAFYSYPRLRGNIFLNYSLENQNLRWTSRYWKGTLDRNTFQNGAFAQRDDRWVHDFTYRLTLPNDWALTGTVKNVFDDQPPFYKSQYNYDYMTQSPLGRVFELGLLAKF